MKPVALAPGGHVEFGEERRRQGFSPASEPMHGEHWPFPFLESFGGMVSIGTVEVAEQGVSVGRKVSIQRPALGRKSELKKTLDPGGKKPPGM